MTTPKAILVGFSLVALAIASLPYSNGVVPEAQAMPCATIVETNWIRDDLDMISRKISSNFFALSASQTTIENNARYGIARNMAYNAEIAKQLGIKDVKKNVEKRLRAAGFDI